MDSAPRRCLVIAALVLVPAVAQGADFALPDAVPHVGSGYGSDRDVLSRRSTSSPGRPYRPVAGGPGYVGSDYGLGKPAVTGLGSRPDWGRSFVD
jgi:hypothetical protein